MERGGVDERKSWNRIEDSAGAIEPQDETLLLASPHLCPPPTHTICKPRFRENHFLSLICSHSGPRSSGLWTPSVYQLPSLSRFFLRSIDRIGHWQGGACGRGLLLSLQLSLLLSGEGLEFLIPKGRQGNCLSFCFLADLREAGVPEWCS